MRSQLIHQPIMAMPNKSVLEWWGLCDCTNSRCSEEFFDLRLRNFFGGVCQLHLDFQSRCSFVSLYNSLTHCFSMAGSDHRFVWVVWAGFWIVVWFVVWSPGWKILIEKPYGFSEFTVVPGVREMEISSIFTWSQLSSGVGFVVVLKARAKSFYLVPTGVS